MRPTSLTVGAATSGAMQSYGSIGIVDAHRGDGKRFVLRADEKLTAFLELERVVCIHLLSEQR